MRATTKVKYDRLDLLKGESRLRLLTPEEKKEYEELARWEHKNMYRGMWPGAAAEINRLVAGGD